MSFIPQEMDHRYEWMAADVEQDLIYQLCCTELEALIEESKRIVDGGFDEHRISPVFRKLVAMIEDRLFGFPGFVLVRGMQGADFSSKMLQNVYSVVCQRLGTLLPQNQHMQLFVSVTDRGEKLLKKNSRGAGMGGGEKFNFHSDVGGVVGLLCLQVGERGGSSQLVNAINVHNDLLRINKHMAAALYNPVPIDSRGEIDGKEYYELPIFTSFKNSLYVHYVRSYIDSSQNFIDAPKIPENVTDAMNELDRLIMEHSRRVTFEFQKGDMQFINNFRLLHSRTKYIDNPEKGLVRHLKRAWINPYKLANSTPDILLRHPAIIR